ncbi:hypothetical protein [Burkholderia cepacia]|nr:hypothetical protein [Burkholderia cepacia]
MTVSSRASKIRAEHRATRQRRKEMIAALYPSARTLSLTLADPIGQSEASEAAIARLPRTLTFVTPDHADVTRDHLFVGALPVLSANSKWDEDFEELNFEAPDGETVIRGHLRLTRERTQGFGVVDVEGHSFAVEYAVKPQTYRLKLAKGAAYVAGTSIAPDIRWDVESERWRTAQWPKEYSLEFTYGITKEEIVEGEPVFEFVTRFKDLTTGHTWEPEVGTYAGFLNRDRYLNFVPSNASEVPNSGHVGGNLFPYKLKLKLSEFADTMVGGILTEKPDLSGTVYGVEGVWTSSNIAGLYCLTGEGYAPNMLVSVHDGRLHVGTTAVPDAVIDGNVLRWRNLAPELCAASGLPESGHLTFSSDGDEIVDSSMDIAGARVHPDIVSVMTHSLKVPDSLRTALGKVAAVKDTAHTVQDLIRMSQFVRDSNGQYYDLFQQQSMEDFYEILQYYMDDKDCKQFFNPNPKPLPPSLIGISQTPGTRGGNPPQFYRKLSVAYTCGTLAEWSTDPAARTLNGRRANAWLTNESGVSDVMQAQAPLLYARRYQEKWTDLSWFVQDQIDNAATYAPRIDAKVAEWLTEARDNFAGTTEELNKLLAQIREIGEKAKATKSYWAFVMYVYTSRPPYLNMLQAVVFGGAEVDGSEFTQRVQRTVALLNVLDTSSYFASQYSYMLQLFQVATLLPQLISYDGDIKDFNFALKQIVDKFVDEYIKSPDPKMREAAEEVRKHGAQATVDQLLDAMRVAAATSAGLFQWATFAARYESVVGKVLSALPMLVARVVLVGAAGLLISLFVQGTVNWSDLTAAEQAQIIAASVGFTAQIVLMLAVRGIALGRVFAVEQGLWGRMRAFFSPQLLTHSSLESASGFKAWLFSNGALERELDGLAMRALFAESAAEGAALLSRANRIATLQRIFGRNLNEFIATRLGAVLATVGIVMSAIALAEGGESLEVAANALFLAASILEFIATAGAWACGAFGVATLGGVSVGTLFAVVSVIGVIALLTAAVLIAIQLFRSKPSPVEQFAKNRAGVYYMRYETDIDYFQVYQPIGQMQRSGVALKPNGDASKSLYIGGDGKLSQQRFDGTGHCAFYLSVDQDGRAQFGAPVVGSDGKKNFFVLGVDKDGRLAAIPAPESAATDKHLQWRAEILGDAQYDTVNDAKYLKSAPFRFYSESLASNGQEKWYLSTDNAGGWTLTRDTGTTLVVEMVSIAPQLLSMTDISWSTYQHDQRQKPSLGVIGSAPLAWSLSPGLPANVQFDTSTGVVSMETGKDIPIFAKKVFKLTASNMVGSAETSFSIEVLPSVAGTLVSAFFGRATEQEVSVPQAIG